MDGSLDSYYRLKDTDEIYLLVHEEAEDYGSSQRWAYYFESIREPIKHTWRYADTCDDMIEVSALEALAWQAGET